MNTNSYESPVGAVIVPASRDGTCHVRVTDRERLRAARVRQLAPRQAVRVAGVLSALGSPTRVQIIAALGHAELCVCEIAVLTGASQSATSHALRKLRMAGLVAFRRDGKIAHYRVADVTVLELIQAANATMGPQLRKRHATTS